MKKCPKCGEEIQENALICKHCGESLNHNSEDEEQTDTICEELTKNYITKGVDYNLFHKLHHDGKKLIMSWFKRSFDMPNSDKPNPFVCFIYTWISFNSWGACVTDEDNDSPMIKELMSDNELNDTFDRLLKKSDSKLKKSAMDFYELWPIYKSQEIRHKGEYLYSYEDRKQLTEHYRSVGIEKYEPQCYWKHCDNDEMLPLDWSHTLAALYRVRCNLFHGEKSAISENDKKIVDSAFLVLFSFIEEGKLFVKPKPGREMKKS